MVESFGCLIIFYIGLKCHFNYFVLYIYIYIYIYGTGNDNEASHIGFHSNVIDAKYTFCQRKKLVSLLVYRMETTLSFAMIQLPPMLLCRDGGHGPMAAYFVHQTRLQNLANTN